MHLPSKQATPGQHRYTARGLMHGPYLPNPVGVVERYTQQNTPEGWPVLRVRIPPVSGFGTYPRSLMDKTLVYGTRLAGSNPVEGTWP